MHRFHGLLRHTYTKNSSSYSDDGSMTLALSQSIIDAEGAYDHALSIKYFLEWMFGGRFSTIDTAWDVGLSTRMALLSWNQRGVDLLQTTQDHINRTLDREDRSGNGSLMRIAPIGVRFWRDPEHARRVAREHGRSTHPALACVEACELYTLLVCEVMRGMVVGSLGCGVGVW